ncbi:MAG: HAMP domain-containing sensor histidine kinase [Nitrospirae bacterium]|nr:MAG: HAMP domain-containing sensor histidine kinase [Nitrospirota bacterium]
MKIGGSVLDHTDCPETMDWITYHIGEDFLIALICFGITARVLRKAKTDLSLDREKRSRLFIFGSGFAILGLSSFIHASIHTFDLNTNILYQTLLGYCFGLLMLIAAVTLEKPWNKKTLPLLYLPLVLMLSPYVYEQFPIFNQFRPLVWLIVSYLSGLICMLYLATFYYTKNARFVLSSIGHLFICIASIILFFPASIGADPWTFGHLIRPLGFVILFFSVTSRELGELRSSVLYRALTAFSLLASIPLLVSGVVMLYENLNPGYVIKKEPMVFALLLITLASALIFGLGMTIRLIRPLLRLKDSVIKLADEGFNKKIAVDSTDEIGELSNAFNDMTVKLRSALDEQDRLSRLAATGELAATLAHEIKNPLNAISGAAVYLEENFKGGLIQEFVKIINSEAQRINKLTMSLLNFAAPVKPALAPSDINSLVRETRLLLEQESKDRGVIIEAELDAKAPLIDFDYDQIKQVLINFIVNAMDAAAANGLVKIKTRISNGGLLLSVEDNGRGIKEEDLKNIFNPFFTTKTRGVGLGLAVSRKIAKEHSGDILAESIPGKGCRFTLMLPVKRK